MSAEKYTLKLGASTRCANNLSTAQAAALLSEGGFGFTELCFVQSDLNGFSYNARADISAITPALVKEKADIYRDSGIEVVSLGVFTKLLEKDEAEREKTFDFFLRHMEYAAFASIPVLATECGFAPGARGINADTYESDYSLFKESLAHVAAQAEKYGISIALEGCQLDIIQCPRRLNTLIKQLRDEYGVTNVGALLDYANYIAVADENDAFKYLSDCTCYMHGKDRLINAAYGVNFGDGDISWTDFFLNYIKHTPDCPFILEYSNADNLTQTGQLVRELFQKACSLL